MAKASFWGAQAASLQSSATCRRHRLRTRLSGHAKKFSASCRKGQAGSLCSPEKNAESRIPIAASLTVMMFAMFASVSSSFGTTKGLSQIVTPDLQGEGDLSLSLQIQDKRIANPYELQAEMGLTKWAEVAVFRGFQPDEWILGTEIGLLTKEPFLLSIGFVNWSPHLDVDPQPYIEAGYYTEHHKVIVGAIHAGYKNEAILGYAYDFNETWRVQVDFQSGSENSSTIGFTCNVTRNFQFNPALYVNNGPKHDLFGYIVFTYTFHLWGDKKENSAGLSKSDERVAGAK
jgi:hypothetical protein